MAERGQGSYVYTVDGRRHLDMACGIGVLSTGHCHPKVCGYCWSAGPQQSVSPHETLPCMQFVAQLIVGKLLRPPA